MIVALAAAWAGLAAQQRSVWDGVYTSAQADRGEKLYAQSCAGCHGDTLGGVEAAPPLAGDVFNTNWEGQTLEVLLDRMRTTMPADKPGTLTRAQNADILAHMLRAGSFPAGTGDLPNDAASLSGIRFLTHKPAPVAAAGQVPVYREPHHQVVHEDARLRVLDVNLPPRALTLDHLHERDIATVSISAADTRSIAPGQPWGPVRPRRDVGHAQTTEYTGKPGSHVIENVGDTLYRLIAVENLREGNWTAGAAMTAAATTLAVESRAFRIYDVRLRGDSPATRHTHAAPVVAVLAAGAATAAGQRLDTPGQWVVVPAAATHDLSSTAGAHVVEIELR